MALEQINIANKIEKVRAMMLLAADEKTPYWKIINVKAHFWECYVLTVVEASGVAARFTLSCAQWCKNLTQFNKLLAHREIFTEKERANFNQEGGYQVLSPEFFEEFKKRCKAKMLDSKASIDKFLNPKPPKQRDLHMEAVVKEKQKFRERAKAAAKEQ